MTNKEYYKPNNLLFLIIKHEDGNYLYFGEAMQFYIHPSIGQNNTFQSYSYVFTYTPIKIYLCTTKNKWNINLVFHTSQWNEHLTWYTKYAQLIYHLLSIISPI